MGFIESLKSRAKQVKSQIIVVFYASQDSRVDFFPRFIVGLAILYSLSPIDLIPDFIPILGYLDDLIIIPALISLAIFLIPKEVIKTAIKRAEDEPLQLKKNWTFAVLFIGLWILLAYLGLSFLLKLLRD